MTCCVCETPAVASNRYEDFCQFHWDCLQHERKIRIDAVRDFGEGYYIGPQFGCTFYGYLNEDQATQAKYSTIGYCLLLSYSPREAMQEALRIAARNNWKLLRLDVQAAAEDRLKLRSCTDLYVSPEFTTYMEYATTPALPYDEARWGSLVK
jgi:hypothetical protein